MKAAALTLVVALSLSASAFAQQGPRNEREYRDSYDHFSVGLRNSLPTGNALDGVDWDDLVSGGIGLQFQYSALWRANSWNYGGYYFGVAVDSFGGRTSTLSGATVRTDRLNMVNVEFGGKLRQNFNGFFVDEHVGIGAAVYMKQELDIRNGGPEGLELIESSVNYLFDIGVRIGAPIGRDVELALGVSYHMNGAPSEGEDFSGLKFKAQQNIVFGLTLDFGF